jgi:hypothetical protein
MQRPFRNTIESFEIQERKRFEYFLEKAKDLNIKNLEKAIKEAMKGPRVMQTLERMANKNVKKPLTVQGKWFIKKTRSAQIECTERISPMCLKKFLSASQDTVCIRCRSIIKK